MILIKTLKNIIINLTIQKNKLLKCISKVYQKIKSKIFRVKINIKNKIHMIPHIINNNHQDKMIIVAKGKICNKKIKICIINKVNFNKIIMVMIKVNTKIKIMVIAEINIKIKILIEIINKKNKAEFRNKIII